LTISGDDPPRGNTDNCIILQELTSFRQNLGVEKERFRRTPPWSKADDYRYRRKSDETCSAREKYGKICPRRMIANGDAAPLEKIPYVDYPELRINKNESTEMPFRYVKGENGESIMPEVCSKAENLWWNVLTSKGNDRVNQERFRKGFWRFILSGRVASTPNLERSRLVSPRRFWNSNV
jgi:hypothetical protein